MASEFVGTSITSQAWAQARLDRLRAENPHMKLVDGRHRGYARVELAPGRMQVELRALDSASSREAACTTLATFVVEDGKPGAQRA
ncbi:Alkaline phosphatase D precursor [compost metagenome]